jgi:hypothetical protein
VLSCGGRFACCRQQAACVLDGRNSTKCAQYQRSLKKAWQQQALAWGGGLGLAVAGSTLFRSSNAVQNAGVRRGSMEGGWEGHQAALEGCGKQSGHDSCHQRRAAVCSVCVWSCNNTAGQRCTCQEAVQPLQLRTGLVALQPVTYCAECTTRADAPPNRQTCMCHEKQCTACHAFAAVSLGCTMTGPHSSRRSAGGKWRQPLGWPGATRWVLLCSIQLGGPFLHKWQRAC